MYNLLLKKTIYLLRSALNFGALPDGFKITKEEAFGIYKIANAHDVGHLVSYALDKNKLLDTRDKDFFDLRQVYLRSIRRCTRQDYVLSQIEKEYGNAGIDYIILKGSVIRNLYPERWMRTSGDIDILVREKDYERATELLKTDLQYQEIDKCNYHTSFSNDKNVEIEIHLALTRTDNKIEKTLTNSVWNNAKPNTEKPHNFVMSDDSFYIFHIFHMLSHFEKGGCGIRFFIDHYLISHMNISDKEKAEREKIICSFGYKKFEEGVNAFSTYIMEDDLEKEISDKAFLQMMDYVVNAGTYGTTSQLVKIKSDRAGGRTKYFINRTILPYDEISARYPVLKKHKILTPLYEVRRCFGLLFGRKNNARRQIKAASRISSKNNYTEMIEMLGL